MPLSDLQCRTTKPRTKTYKLSDGDGLYLEVVLQGHKYWRFKYRIHDKEKKLSIGVYPEIPLLEARQQRDEARKAIRNNVDPSILKQESKRLARFKASQTFELIAREWHEHYKNTWSKSHADNIIYRLELDLFPQIGRYPLSQLTVPMIFSCLQKIEARGAHEMVRRALQMCGQIFRYAVITGRVERDITTDLKGALKKYKKGHYASIEIEELPKLLKTINNNEARLFRQTILTLKLMLLTFVRTTELIEAKWSEIDLDKAEWNIPAERMKMRSPHFVPLSHQAVEILKELQEMNGKRDFVFPSVFRPQKPTSNGAILSALKRLGYGRRMTGHGFRALAMSTIKEKLGYQHEVVDRQLAHLPRSKVDQAYDRAKFLSQRIKMMQDWADHIDGLS